MRTEVQSSLSNVKLVGLLDVESEEHDVAFCYDIFFAFASDEPFFFGGAH